MPLSPPSWRPACLIWRRPLWKFKRWLIVTQLEKFIEVIKSTEAHYINGDVVEKWIFTPSAPAKVRKYVIVAHGIVNDIKSDVTTSSAVADANIFQMWTFCFCSLCPFNEVFWEIISCLKSMVGCFVTCNQSIYLGLMDNVLMSEAKKSISRKREWTADCSVEKKRTFYDECNSCLKKHKHCWF